MLRNLLDEMAARQLTVADLAECLRIGEKTLRRRLAGTAPFTLGEIRKIVRLFPGRTVDDLFADDGLPPDDRPQTAA